MRKREPNTARFWMAIFHREFPAALQLYPVQEHPPVGRSRRKVDCKVYCFANGNERNFLYVEFKRANVGPAKRREGQNQVTRHCRSLLREELVRRRMRPNNQNEPYVRFLRMDCMLCYGRRAAIWQVSMNGIFGNPNNFVDADSLPAAQLLLSRFRALRDRYGIRGPVMGPRMV